MKPVLFMFVSACLLCGFILPAEAQKLTPMRVTAERVNLRAKPTLNAEVVGQLQENAQVSVRSIQDEWVEIVPPETIDLWVHRDFVRMGVVQTKNLNVRAGPGINYNVVGDLNRGDAVVPRGEFGEWLKIAPPENSSLWMHSEYVESVRPSFIRRSPQPAPQPQPATTRATVRRPAPVITPVPPAAPPQEPQMVVQAAATGEESQLPDNWELVPLEGQGKRVEREGVLRQVGFLLGRPTRYRLVRYEGNTLVTICYIRGNRAQLNDWIGERLLIRGREYWIKDSEYPVLIVEQLLPRLQRLPR